MPDTAGRIAMASRITASARAQALLDRLQDRHGPLTLHVSGSYGVTVICLPRAELRLGGLDILMGAIGAVPLYMMSSEIVHWRGAHLRLDLAEGCAPGFSLEAPERVHFTLLKEGAVMKRLKEAVGVEP